MTDAENLAWSNRVARANQIADALCGTCGDLDDHITEEERDNVELLKEVDDIVFCCDQCGWWCEIGDQSEREDDQICNDCNDE